MGIMRFRPFRAIKKFLSTTYTKVSGKELFALYAIGVVLGAIAAYFDVATAPLFGPYGLSIAHFLGL